MNNLVEISKNKQAVTTSIRIAEVFGKRHDNVMKSVNRLIGELRAQEDFTHLKNEVSKYTVGEYTDSTGRKLKQYVMNRDGFTLLAMGFTGKKALEFKIKYINAFNEMEAKLRALEVQKKVETLTAARSTAGNWDVSDADLIRCLHNWHATKNKKETQEFQQLHAENEELRHRLNLISQALE